MVSRYKRHLSLFLVIVLVMSWFVVPVQVISALSTSTGSLEVAPKNYALTKGYRFSYVEDTANPSGIIFSWDQPNAKSIASSFSLFSPTGSRDGVFVLRYKIQYMVLSKDNDTVTENTCKSSSHWLDLDTFQDDNAVKERVTYKAAGARNKISGAAFFRLVLESGLGGTIAGELPVVACGTKPIKTTDQSLNSNKITIKLESNPTGAKITIDGKSPLEFANQSKNTTPLTIITDRLNQPLVQPDTSKLKFEGFKPRTVTVKFTLDGFKDESKNIELTENQVITANFQLQGKKDSNGQPIQVIDINKDVVPNAGGVLAPFTASTSAYFSSIKNKANTTIDNEGDLKLSDSPDDNTGDINNDGLPDPVKPPIITIAKSALNGMPDDLIFTLTNLVRSPEEHSIFHWGTDNNYFLFKMLNLSKAQKEVLNKNGITDPSLIYLTIDIRGNVGILIEDKSKEGGIFATKKATFDESDKNFLILGKFDSNNAVSPIIINLKQYHDIITRRVYNDANPGSQLDTGCLSTKLIHYPVMNTSYEDISRFSDAIPFGPYRKCINIDPQGWLMTWGVKDSRIDQVPVDDCEKAFGGERGWLSFLTNAAAKSICFILGVIINSATWMAGYSIDFLLKTISLQVR